MNSHWSRWIGNGLLARAFPARTIVRPMVLATFVLCAFGAGRCASAAHFVPLGVPIPPAQNVTPHSGATDVSSDGLVVVGYNSFSVAAWYGYSQAFRWTSEGGKVVFGLLPGDFVLGSAAGVSADGSVVVGSSYNPAPAMAFRWTSESGIVQLGTLPGDTFSTASGVSANGAVVVGASVSTSSVESISEAFRWTSDGGMIGLGDLPGGRTGSQATGVSADGSVVAGWSFAADGIEAFRWTRHGGMVGLGDLPGADFESHPAGVSSDGSVIVGWGRSHPEAPEAFRWTNADGMVGLGYLAGGERWSVANDVSADGAVIVGASSSAIGQEAFIWDASDGMRSVSDVLTTTLGVDLTGWRLTSATAISADAMTIVGYGTNPSGQQEAWLANINPVPEPSSLVLAALAAAGLLTGICVQRRRQSSDSPRVAGNGSA